MAAGIVSSTVLTLTVIPKLSAMVKQWRLRPLACRPVDFLKLLENPS
jgi:hypothetical protein